MLRRPSIRRDSAGRKGQALVEFALVLPLLLLLLLAIIGYGLAFYRSLTVGNVARVTVRSGVIGATPCQMYNQATQLLQASGMNNPPTMTFTYTQPASASYVCSIPSVGNCGSPPESSGQYLTLSVAYPATSPVPLPGLGSSYTITQSASMMIEAPGNVSLPLACP